MAYDTQTLERLGGDARAILARYPEDPRSALLPLLHLVQSEDGYVSPHGITFCARTLGLTTAEVSAVATFYTQYKRHPNGEYTVGVCINTLCAVMGGDAIWEELSDHLGVGHDETTEDGAITLERIECNAACDFAPVMMVNWEFFDNQTPESATATVDALRAGEQVAPTRGAASVCSFKAMSRVLAGFPDGRADEGVGAGEPTLRGTRLASERGWAAPPLPGEVPDAVVRRAPRKRTTVHSGADAASAGSAPAGSTPVETQPAGTKPARAPRAPRTARSPRTRAASEPAPGTEQSSAERPAVTPADSAPETVEQQSDAKES